VTGGVAVCLQAYLDELVELHKRLMTLREGHILQQVCMRRCGGAAPPVSISVTGTLTVLEEEETPPALPGSNAPLLFLF